MHSISHYHHLYHQETKKNPNSSPHIKRRDPKKDWKSFQSIRLKMFLRRKKDAFNPWLSKEGVIFNTKISLEHYLPSLFYYGLSNPGSSQISYHFYKYIPCDPSMLQQPEMQIKSKVFLVLESHSRGFLVFFLASSLRDHLVFSI